MDLRFDQKVLWLDVSVDHVVAVAVLDSFKQLVDVVTYAVKVDSIRVFFQYLEQVLLQVFEDQV